VRENEIEMKFQRPSDAWPNRNAIRNPLVDVLSPSTAFEPEEVLGLLGTRRRRKLESLSFMKYLFLSSSSRNNTFSHTTSQTLAQSVVEEDQTKFPFPIPVDGIEARTEKVTNGRKQNLFTTQQII
jgi:hypothetical protein